ncbi:MAG: U32 family peptidase [Salinivirgaceae bacterium]|nr:U32 family peptidase [Salinivirgaceae bacterium]
MPKLELLAPAKNAEIAFDAINHGADAIYMGASRFGAREQASNTIEEIETVVNYAHLFGVKVYCTVNTILYNDELESAQQLIRDLWNIGVDAIIVQDVSVFEMDLPPMRFHVSTQTNNRTLEQVDYWDRSGVSRVILARELSLAEIATIRANTKVELEAFIHGSLCVSYSGNCYLSSDISHRSANRGNCAQPCRLPYDLVNSEGEVLIHNKHILSLGDLDATAVLGDLIKSGVTSFKIEGRLKDASYVKNITAHYHNLLNKFIAQNGEYSRSSHGRVTVGFEPDPERTFNRGTSTFFYKERMKDLVNLGSPKSLGKYMGTINQVGTNWFSMEGNEPLTNGDGICFFVNGAMKGTQIEGVTKIGYKAQDMTGIRVGLKIYRNRDHGFLKMVDNSIKGRGLGISIELAFFGQELNVKITSENKMFSCTKAVDAEEANNQERAKEVWQTQFAKTGDSGFIADQVVVVGAPLPHMPVSKINELRRDLLDRYTEFLLLQHKNQRDVSDLKTIPYHKTALTYQHNVSNQLADAYYTHRGVTDIEPAFEIEKPNYAYRVMTTKYCVLFEMGKCKKLVKGVDRDLKEPLFLVHRERRYPLEFDCAKCEMIIKTEEQQ